MAIFVFFIFRLILFFTQTDKWVDVTFFEIVKAFWMGVRFDVVITGYLLIIPTVILSIFTFIGKKIKLMEKIITIFLTLILSISFIVCGADIPYFNQFFERFNVGAFNWMNGEGGIRFVVNMIIEEPRYWLMIIPIILLSFGCYLSIKHIFNKTEKWERGSFFSKLIATVLLIGLMFLGMRGRLDEKSPIRIGTAYFCDNAFLNQLGLNPNFTLMQSFLDSKNAKNQETVFMNEQQAIEYVQKMLQISQPNPNFPIAREIVSDSISNKYNVVVIIMESMSAEKMRRHGNTKNLTPFLDSLSFKGLYFDNCYTTGTHTYCGIYSTLCSFPTIYQQHPLKRTPILLYNSMANTLKQNQYSTIFFVPHDSEFDNMNGFLLGNGFDQMISKADYPAQEVKTTLGVPDDFMFRFAIPKLNELHQKKQPFFATFLTASDHGPYFIPDYFTPKNKDVLDQIVEYADYSLQQFMWMAQKEEWFSNTIFAFVADHGNSNNAIYSLPISYIHTPLLFYAPSLLPDSTSDALASQIDLFPTIMGMLNLTYTNNTLGIDLQKESRKFTIATADDKYAVIDNNWYLIVNPKDSKTERLYKYRERDTHDYSNDELNQTAAMKTFGEAVFQTTQFILREHKQNTNNPL
ncbi:MAG: sulfatase-like hydrolase/transferase [Bacteroidales bacterium]|nr:sulfatase-like hydrolase/transferase [Bacteroidales bacterium]